MNCNIFKIIIIFIHIISLKIKMGYYFNFYREKLLVIKFYRKQEASSFFLSLLNRVL